MMTFGSVSDLGNKFADIEGESCSRMKQNIEQALDEADAYAEATTERMTHEEVFGKLRNL